MDPNLLVLARNPEEWRAFVQSQLEINRQWANRNTVIDDDRRMPAAMGIAVWNDPMLEEYLLAILLQPLFT